ncbi:hypothetical protein C8R43DRAFT_1135708 [Mycena crocata]|nr:hypothetical protein C8R43DRAFT_1135708 [Mycena crocata]
MTPPLPSPLLGAALLSVFYFAIFYYRRKALLPPGPKGFPLIGNLLDVPKTEEWLAFLEMSRKYDSDIISVNLMGDTIVVLNSLKACQDLLDVKSSIYSDRPPFRKLNDLMGFDWHFGFMPYGPVWKRKSFLPQDVYHM